MNCLKVTSGHDKYDSTLRQRLAPILVPLTLKYASPAIHSKGRHKVKGNVRSTHETSFDFINKLFKDKAKANFWLYTPPNTISWMEYLSIMAYNGDWNYLWLSLIAYFLFGCVGMAIGLHRYWGPCSI